MQLYLKKEDTCESNLVGLQSSRCMSDLVDVGQRLLILDQHLGKLQTLVWTDAHHISQ